MKNSYNCTRHRNRPAIFFKRFNYFNFCLDRWKDGRSLIDNLFIYLHSLLNLSHQRFPTGSAWIVTYRSIQFNGQPINVVLQQIHPVFSLFSSPTVMQSTIIAIRLQNLIYQRRFSYLSDYTKRIKISA